MIRCRECDTINDDTAGFCGGCGQFLEWTGERVDESGQPVESADGQADAEAEARAAAEREAAERAAAEAEAKAQAEREAAERAEAERAEAERAAADAAEREAAERAEAERLAAEAAEREAAERAEAERMAAEAESRAAAEAEAKAQAERLAAEAEARATAEREAAEREAAEAEAKAQAEREAAERTTIEAEAKAAAEREAAERAEAKAQAEREAAEATAAAEAEKKREAARVAAAALLASSAGPGLELSAPSPEPAESAPEEASEPAVEPEPAAEPPPPAAPPRRRGGPSRQSVVTIDDEEPEPDVPATTEPTPADIAAAAAAAASAPGPTAPPTPPPATPTAPPPVTPSAPAAAPGAMWGSAAAEPEDTIVVQPRPPAAAPTGQPPATQPGARLPGAAATAAAAGAAGAAASSPPARPPGVPQTSQPEARKPTFVPDRPKPTAPGRPVEARVAQPGDRICSNCSEPNDPTRKFCRRCGTSLAAAPVQAAVRLPWWKRIFRREPRPAKTYAAGERTGSMQPKGAKGAAGAARKLPQVGTLIKGGLGLLIGFGIIGAVVFPSIPQMLIAGGTGFVDDIRKMFVPTFAIVHPIGATASSEIEGHPAALVIDDAVNTDWQSTEATPTLTVTFQNPIDLGAVYVHSGTAEDFVDIRRPSRLEFVFPDGSSKTIDLVDDHAPQQFQIDANDIKTLQVKILATNGPDTTPVALSEIEFFMKK